MPTLPTTVEAVRDRLITVVRAIVPTVNDHDLFTDFPEREDGVLETWAEASPQKCTRVFQVRDTGDDRPPPISNHDVEEREVAFVVTIAYAQTSRLGRGARERVDAIAADKKLLERAIGAAGRANFAPPHPDACWRKESSWGEVSRTERQRGENGVDYLRIWVVMSFAFTP